MSNECQYNSLHARVATGTERRKLKPISHFKTGHGIQTSENPCGGFCQQALGINPGAEGNCTAPSGRSPRLFKTVIGFEFLFSSHTRTLSMNQLHVNGLQAAVQNLKKLHDLRPAKTASSCPVSCLKFIKRETKFAPDEYRCSSLHTFAALNTKRKTQWSGASSRNGCRVRTSETHGFLSASAGPNPPSAKDHRLPCPKPASRQNTDQSSRWPPTKTSRSNPSNRTSMSCRPQASTLARRSTRAAKPRTA